MIGAGVAGLAAIQCPISKKRLRVSSACAIFIRQAKNMGCIVRAFDVRPATREQVVAAGGRATIVSNLKSLGSNTFGTALSGKPRVEACGNSVAVRLLSRRRVLGGPD